MFSLELHLGMIITVHKNMQSAKKLSTWFLLKQRLTPLWGATEKDGVQSRHKSSISKDSFDLASTPTWYCLNTVGMRTNNIIYKCIHSHSSQIKYAVTVGANLFWKHFWKSECLLLLLFAQVKNKQESSRSTTLKPAQFLTKHIQISKIGANGRLSQFKNPS